MTGPGRTWLLELSEPGRDGRRIELRGELTVGSGPSRPGHLELHDTTVAPEHLLLDGSAAELVGHALGAGLPVLVDGRPVHEPTTVPAGTTITVGGCSVRVLGWV